MQIVYDVATAEDENAFFSQLRQAFTDLVVERGRLGFINAQLDNRDISSGIEMEQNRPSTVIEAPPIVAAHWHRREQFLDANGEVRVAGRGILHLIQLARKAAEVVDGSWRGAHGDSCVFDNQCADTESIAFGLGKAAPMAAHRCV